MQDEAGGTDCGVLGCRDEGVCGTCQAAETALGEYLGTPSNWVVLESVEGESVCWETQSARPVVVMVCGRKESKHVRKRESIGRDPNPAPKNNKKCVCESVKTNV